MSRWTESLRLAVDPMRLALAAEFESPDALAEAAAQLRARGFERLDAYTPYPVPGMEDALGLRRTRIPLLGLVAGLLGALTGYLVQWWISAVDYPLDVGGRPFHSAPSFVVVSFETAVLFAAVAVFAALWLRGRMPEPWNPLFEVEGFDRASCDRYWLGVDARDPRLTEAVDLAALRGTLKAAGALRIVEPERVEPTVELPEVGS